jgi:hypothetical protein
VKQRWGDLTSFCRDRGVDRRRVRPVIFEEIYHRLVPGR